MRQSMHNTLQSGQVAKEKDAPCSKAKKSPSYVLYFALVRSLKKKCIVSRPKCICGQRSKMAFRARQAAATLLLLKYKYGHSFLLAYIEKMAACNFLSSMKILIHLAKF